MYDPDRPKELRDAPWFAKQAFTLGHTDNAIDPEPAPEPAAETYEAAASMGDLIQSLHPGAEPRHDAEWQAQYDARIDTARDRLWKED